MSSMMIKKKVGIQLSFFWFLCPSARLIITDVRMWNSRSMLCRLRPPLAGSDDMFEAKHLEQDILLKRRDVVLVP